MKAENFAYWLMGFFELSNTTSITTSQIATIDNHLKLTMTHDGSGDDETHRFINWLAGYLARNGNQELAEADLTVVTDRLAELFKHEIDSRMEPDDKTRDILQKIHDGFTKANARRTTAMTRGSGEIRFMC